MIPSNFRIEILSIRALLCAIGSKGLFFFKDNIHLSNPDKLSIIILLMNEIFLIHTIWRYFKWRKYNLVLRDLLYQDNGATNYYEITYFQLYFVFTFASSEAMYLYQFSNYKFYYCLYVIRLFN